MEFHTKVQVLLHHHLNSIIFFLLHIRYFNKSDHNFLRAALEKKLLNSDHLSLILPLATTKTDINESEKNKSLQKRRKNVDKKNYRKLLVPLLVVIMYLANYIHQQIINLVQHI